MELNILEEIAAAKNQEIYNAFIVLKSKLDNPCYEEIMCSVSGGSDSDLLIDMIVRLGCADKVKFVWIDTGLEFQATKDHLKRLEEKYGIKIETAKAAVSIPQSVRTHGQPFISKQVSEFIYRLQGYGFNWEDEPLEVLLERYCIWDEEKQDYKGCKSALEWWCDAKGEGSMFGISRNKYLKEFLVANPPEFLIANKCCVDAKKIVKHTYIEENNVDLSIVGIRKAEGGVRSSAYKSCFSANKDTNTNDKVVADEFRPIFWFKGEEKRLYVQTYGVEHSECYSTYGLKRTGCSGCPFSQSLEVELKAIETYEPKLFKAVNNIFGLSYEYTRKYHEFRKTYEPSIPASSLRDPSIVPASRLKKKPEQAGVQLSLFELLAA